MFEVTFLGTRASFPSKESALAACIIQHNNKRFLIDCPEGILRQILSSPQRIRDPFTIIVTHEHIDHLLGIIGLFHYIDLTRQMRYISVICPTHAKQKIERLIEVSDLVGGLGIHYNEVVRSGMVYDDEELIVEAFKTDHTSSSYGFIFVEKPKRKFFTDKAVAAGVPQGPLWRSLQDGKSIVLTNGREVTPDQVLGSLTRGTKAVFLSDTAPSDTFKKICEGADLLVTEMTYLDSEFSEAEKYKHLTASDVAGLIRNYNIPKAYVNHISPRYSRSEVEMALSSMRGCWMPGDFDVINVSHE
jgi:ribonuclease Z